MSFSSKLLKFMTKFRYHVEIKGLELLDTEGTKLLLPTHVALMDPVIIFAYLGAKNKISPVVTEKYYNVPILKQFFNSVGTISIPDLNRDNNKLDTSVIVGKILETLKNDRNILLYPQGTLARQGFQSIVGKKTAFLISQQIPQNTKILTINIRGLWGSRSSRARTGQNPSLALFILKGLRFIIGNLFFFVPKRKVEIEIKDSTAILHKVKQKGLDTFNQELEKIYNAKGEEKLNYLSGLFRYNTVKNHKEPGIIKGSIKDLQRASFKGDTNIPTDILNKISTIIKRIKPEFSGKIDLNTNLILDCFFDSLDMAELKSTIQSVFSNASNPPLLDLKTIGDIAVMAMGHTTTTEETKQCNWKYSTDKKPIYTHIKGLLNKDSTILTLMKEALKNNKSDSFCYDSLFGVQSKKDFLIKAYLIADLLKKMPGEKVAIMLPSLSTTSLLIIGCYLAKKIPVMLNWTQSKEAFDHCVKSQDTKVILTAKSFFQKIQKPWLQKYEMTFFEDILKNVSLIQKIKAVFNATNFKIPTNISKIAVVLFTSGSEALPKTVELTHENILNDLLGAAGIVEIGTNDIEICYLPPFHSFGFTLGIILPLISGIRIAFTPDPNDSITIANLINHTKSTFLCSTPTFLNRVIQTAKDDQLKSLRITIIGAERCPKELFTNFSKKSPNATIIEGYGITECSPVIAVNPFKRKAQIKRGTVGLPILGQKVKILNLDTHEEQPPKKEGMIYVSGLNVFEGYIDKKLESPFEEFDGKKWYKTGDLGYLDKDGYLVISGRLKRFIKIAGEMISLPAIESTLSRKWKHDDGTECLAIEAEENPNGNVKLTLFTTEKLGTKEVNDYLHSEGITNLININSIIQLKEIPMLGTGKVDYVQLKSMLKTGTTSQIKKTSKKSDSKTKENTFSKK